MCLFYFLFDLLSLFQPQTICNILYHRELKVMKLFLNFRSNPGTPTQPRRPDFIVLNQQQQQQLQNSTNPTQSYYEYTTSVAPTSTSGLPPQHPQLPIIQQQQQQLLMQQQRAIIQQQQQGKWFLTSFIQKELYSLDTRQKAK